MCLIEISSARTFVPVCFQIRMASVLDQQKDEPFLLKDTVYEGCTFRVTRGDYSGLLELVCLNLEKAKVIKFI